MTAWDAYPSDYRSTQIQAILSAIKSGECVSLLGLSGAGKSNLLGFLANRVPYPGQGQFLLVDGNRLPDGEADSFFRLIRSSLGDRTPVSEELPALEKALSGCLSSSSSRLCLLLDRFDRLDLNPSSPIPGNLRSLRDALKYDLTLVISTRHTLDPQTELSELFYNHILWLGPLDKKDSCWSITSYAARQGITWDVETVEKVFEITWGYPSFLRAVVEALANGSGLEVDTLLQQPAVWRRVNEFWADHPTEEEIRLSGLAGHPLLEGSRSKPAIPMDSSRLTAKEHLLLVYFQAHPGAVCEKDDLIRAVWPEDRIFQQGIRDDSLAQLVRRLREKIEVDASHPAHILSLTGRGYRFIP